MTLIYLHLCAPAQFGDINVSTHKSLVELLKNLNIGCFGIFNVNNNNFCFRTVTGFSMATPVSMQMPLSVPYMVGYVPEAFTPSPAPVKKPGSRKYIMLSNDHN